MERAAAGADDVPNTEAMNPLAAGRSRVRAEVAAAAAGVVGRSRSLRSATAAAPDPDPDRGARCPPPNRAARFSRMVLLLLRCGRLSGAEAAAEGTTASPVSLNATAAAAAEDEDAGEEEAAAATDSGIDGDDDGASPKVPPRATRH